MSTFLSNKILHLRKYFEMNLTDLFKNKTLSSKEKTQLISNSLLNDELDIASLLSFANDAKDPIKATCIEAIEFATQSKPSIATADVFNFVVHNLTAKAPRIKWESAKVIGNSASLHTKNLEIAINNLLINTEHEGTVVRWSAAFALGEIIKLKSTFNKDLLPAIDAIMIREEKNIIKKIYLTAIKKI
jgi:hypothetical protein